MSESTAFPLAPPAEPPAACSLCAEPIRSTWYRSGKMTFCPSCRAAAGAERGTPASRALRALGFGAAAAALSAIVWYAVIVWTEREFGLLAIGVGLLVGGAVRLGSHRRGGWRYQALAMTLTYAAIVTAYVPLLFQAAIEASDEAGDPSVWAETAPLAASSEALDRELVDAEKGPAPSAEVTAEPSDTAESGAPLGVAAFLFGLGALAGLVFAAPFLAGFENFFGWVILAIALFEAWRLNRREELVFDGPHHLPGHRASYVPEPPPPPIAP